ncbi:MAG: hypothetical protein MUQ79_06235 [Flavobacteriaceae bacterium]|jgi:hypothetical protein|nr:hypothetical protein [Flavobacteriaceae bacterium]MDO7592008.1 hypothetical protein [Flavobacteriaceae bacterium]MDO7599863.1 hypothetical protein [Flavobacteriaceae bacterium]
MIKQNPSKRIKAFVMILLVWNLLGVSLFVMDLLVDLTKLNDAELEFRSRFPLWIKMFNAAAVTLGLLGSIGLVFRKAWSKSVLVMSLISVIIQMYHSFFVANSLDYLGNSEVILSCIIIAVALTLVWIADFYKGKNWFI